MAKFLKPRLFKTSNLEYPLPLDYIPVRPKYFPVERIYLAKGSQSSLERVRFVERICRLYPGAEIIECLETPHNRIDLGDKDELKRHQRGKHTLVFGEHKSAVRFSDEEGNACPNYWHFSPYGFCFYGCKYCYLAGTPSFWHSPAVRIFLNLEEIMNEIDRAASRRSQPTAFYLGKLQDGLALDPLTAYSTIFVPFFAKHKFAKQIILTKSAEVERLLQLEHNQHTILSWSVNPPPVSASFEENAPSIDQRIQAMRKCADKGYPVRAVMMPIIPVGNWEQIYSNFIERLLSSVPLQRLTLGGICIYQNAKKLMETKLSRKNDLSNNIDPETKLGDGRLRYSISLRRKMYSHLIKAARELKPDLELALCLEETRLWQETGVNNRIGRCNCVL